ncbi:hypothetical protein BX600DRAFT_521242 [Xylariales sp. PMI_506]|nr:hypothetical protein BX600DRAFT_521242 [Xylariales sp. PMI_506]
MHTSTPKNHISKSNSQFDKSNISKAPPNTRDDSSLIGDITTYTMNPSIAERLGSPESLARYRHSYSYNPTHYGAIVTSVSSTYTPPMERWLGQGISEEPYHALAFVAPAIGHGEASQEAVSQDVSSNSVVGTHRSAAIISYTPMDRWLQQDIRDEPYQGFTSIKDS